MNEEQSNEYPDDEEPSYHRSPCLNIGPCLSDYALYAADGDTKGAELYVKWMLWKTERLLTNSLVRVSIQHVAVALLQHRKLSGRQARRVIQAAEARVLSFPQMGLQGVSTDGREEQCWRIEAEAQSTREDVE